MSRRASKTVSLFALPVLLAYGCVVDQPADTAPAGGNVGAGAAAPVAPPGGSAIPAAAEADGRPLAYLGALAERQPPEVRAALEKVVGAPRRLAALRGYMRAGRNFRDRWAWTEEETRAYKETNDYARALAEVEKVRRTFAEMNPGYELRVNVDVRTLEEQIENWNRAESVRAAGERLMESFREELGRAGYGDTPDRASLAKAERFIRGARVSPTPTVAVPGLSPHGRLQAFDFQVESGGQLVAGATSSSIASAWEAQGWAAKLKEAVTRSGAKLKGPLESPREPWHYTYTP